MDIGLLDVVEFEFMYFQGIYGLIYFSVICLGIHTPPIFRWSIKMIIKINLQFYTQKFYHNLIELVLLLKRVNQKSL